MAKQDKNENGCESGCGMCSGEGISSMLEMIARMKKPAGSGISFGMRGLGILMGGAMSSSGRDCPCSACKEHFEMVDDNVIPDSVLKKGKPAMFILGPKNTHQIQEMIALEESLKVHKSDLIIWKRILENKEAAAFEELSESGMIWFKDIASKAMMRVEADDAKDVKEITKKITETPHFVELMIGENPFKNEALKEEIEKVREDCLEDLSVVAQEKIDKIKAALPEEHREATKVPTLEMPLAELEEVIKAHLAAKATS